MLLDRMRELGIYDQATIVISGDHGSFVAPTALLDPAAQATADARGIAPSTVGHARPLLLVKAPGAHGALRTSRAPVWIIDTPATIADAAGLPGAYPGTSALKLAEDAPRERRFHDYEYAGNEWSGEYVADIQEYVVSGRSDDITGWNKGRTLRAPAPADGR